MAHDVFISYSSVNRTAAEAAAAFLEGASVRCWIAPRDVGPGTPWPTAIVDAIDQCRVMVLIFSSAADKSEDVQREVFRAFEGGIPVVPLRVEDIKPSGGLAYYLNRLHWLDALTEPLEQHLRKLVISVQGLLGAGDGQANRQRVSNRRTVPPEGSVVLADVTSDLDRLRERLGRYLEELGFTVVMCRSHGLSPDAFKREFDQQIRGARLFVQLLDEAPSPPLPGLPEGYALWQHQRAAASNVAILQWRDPSNAMDPVEDTEQRKLLNGDTVYVAPFEEFTWLVGKRAGGR